VTQSTVSHGFALLRETGTELLSLVNSDENKVVRIGFAISPSGSTGPAHIL
jgi:Zn-dependent M16 (insulinase) family peptidase